MKITKSAGIIAATAVAFGAGAATVAPAWATDNIKPFNEQERFLGPNGLPIIGYTVKDLQKSSAAVPHNGQLYEATLTIDGFGGGVDPRLSGFMARSRSGYAYPMIPNAPGGLMVGPLPPRGQVTGKLYFDVIGPEPNSVVRNDGMRDILAWIPGMPQGGTRP